MIGLMTPYKVTNYGTKLQAYAVQECISKYDDVEIIRYRPDLPGRVIRKVEKMKLKKYSDIKNTVNTKELSKKLSDKRYTAIHSFDSKLKLASVVVGYRNLRRNAKRYNAVVCGSDQIWNPVNLAERIFMLEFVPAGVRRVSFAPSFGISNLPNELKNQYKKRLDNIDYISVRELSGCKIVETLGRQNVFWCLDPTLILEEEKWEQLAKSGKATPEEPYIFCYFLGNHELERKVVKKLKKLSGYKIVNLPHFKMYVDADENFADYDMYDVTPQDFINLIRNASIVCTDSFHGTAFSIIFEKEFYCCERHNKADVASTNNRIYSILSLLNLTNRMIQDENCVMNVTSNLIDYSTVKATLNCKRKDANKFLSDALGEKK